MVATDSTARYRLTDSHNGNGSRQSVCRGNNEVITSDEGIERPSLDKSDGLGVSKSKRKCATE